MATLGQTEHPMTSDNTSVEFESIHAPLFNPSTPRASPVISELPLAGEVEGPSNSGFGTFVECSTVQSSHPSKVAVLVQEGSDPLSTLGNVGPSAPKQKMSTTGTTSADALSSMLEPPIPTPTTAIPKCTSRDSPPSSFEVLPAPVPPHPTGKHSLVEVMKNEEVPSSLFSQEKEGQSYGEGPWSLPRTSEITVLTGPPTDVTQGPSLVTSQDPPSPSADLPPPTPPPTAIAISRDLYEPPISAPIVQQPTPIPMLQAPPRKLHAARPLSSHSERPKPTVSTKHASDGGSHDALPLKAIEHHLGLIDGDYFLSREPAESIPIVTMPLASSESSLSRSRSADATRPPSTSSSKVPATHHQTHIPAVVPSSPTQTYSRLATPAPPVVSSPFELGSDGTGRVPNTLNPNTTVTIDRCDDEENDGTDSHLDIDCPRDPPKQTPSFNTLSSLPAWVGSYLWGGEDEHQAQTHAASRSRSRSRSNADDSIASTRRLQPPKLVASPSPVATPASSPSEQGGQNWSHAQPLGSRSSSSSGVDDSNGYVHVHGRPGRPLPRARPSLEGIQWMYQQGHAHPHPTTGSGHGQDHRRQGSFSEPQPVNITHSTTFGSPPSPIAVPGSLPGSMKASLSSGSPIYSRGYSNAHSRSVTTSEISTIANPFAVHSFIPIPGAPGFKPEMPHWDKGFSEELEREVVGGDVRQLPDGSGDKAGDKDGRRNEKEQKDGGFGSFVGSRFSAFGFGRKKSDEQGTVGLSRSHTYHSAPSPPTPTKSRNLDIRAGDESRDAMKATIGSPQSVPELIEKKLGSVILNGRKESTEAVLVDSVAALIRGHLPPLSRLPKTWTLLYSLDQHGISLNTLYNNCAAPEKNRKPGMGYIGIGGAVLVLKDSGGNNDTDVFGAFVARGLGNKNKGFFGGGDSFLWKYSKGDLSVFKSTGRNSYFAICENEYMAFGGGATSYGLYLKSGLLEGSSAPCPTFNNEVLCSKPDGAPSAVNMDTPGVGYGGLHSSLTIGQEVKFECVGLEVWGVGPS